MRTENTEFKFAVFVNCTLVGINWLKLQNGSVAFPVEKFEKCYLKYNEFDKMNLKKFDFMQSNIVDCAFANCNLCESNFSDCDLKNTQFSTAI